MSKSHHTRFFIKISIIITLFFSLSAFLGTFAGVYIYQKCSENLDTSLFEIGNIAQSPRFFMYRFSDRAERIGTTEEITDSFYLQKKNAYLQITEIPKPMIDAFVCIEDKRFFEHNGVDWKRTFAAGVNYLFCGDKGFGGSTITQQLVKNMTGKNELTVWRKLHEMLYARKVENSLDKSEILELYLNVIHFSDNCDGISAAAEHYFSKEVSELTVAECASIAAITNNPSYYNPIRYPEHNLERRNLILREMHKNGMLSKEEYVSAAESPISLCVDSVSNREGINSWYADMVIEDVIEDLMETYSLSRSAATHFFYTKGLRIDVAMDQAVQNAVEEYYTKAIRMPRTNGEEAQSALIIIDNRTGDILGVAGAVGAKKGNHLQNFATMTKRAPGSTIKPISVYAPALEEGVITWGSVFDDVPTDFYRDNHVAWPQNATRVYRGLTDVSYAVAHSTNTVAVRALHLLGKDTAFRYAKEKFHLAGLQNGANNDFGDAALALGQLQRGVTLRELTAAYTVFADRGMYHASRSYYRVLNSDGTVLLAKPDTSEEVISEENAAIMTKLLEGVIDYGTAGKITLEQLVDCAGKTGTSGNDHDRWFIGYTPEILCGVWCGYAYPSPLNERNLCTTVWNNVMKRIYSVSEFEKKSFDVPPNVIHVDYCADSGLLPCESCCCDPRGSRIKRGWFIAGSEPTEKCKTHVLCSYDTENGGLLPNGVKGEHVGTVSLIRVERHFPIALYVTDAQYVYRGDPASFPYNPHKDQAYFATVLKDHCGVSNAERQFNRAAEYLPPNTDGEFKDSREDAETSE